MSVKTFLDSLNIFKIIEAPYTQTVLAVLYFTSFWIFGPDSWKVFLLREDVILNPYLGLLFTLACSILLGNWSYSIYINVKFKIWG